MNLGELLRKYLTPVKAPLELDRKIRKMVAEEQRKKTLEQKVLGTWLTTADTCARCKKTPYAQELTSVDSNKPTMTCRYITHDMMQQLEESSVANNRICIYQSRRYQPFMNMTMRSKLLRLLREGLLHQEIKPIGRYECLKFKSERHKKK